MDSLISQLYKTNNLREEEILFVLRNMASEYEEDLFRLAAAMRKKYYKEAVYIRGLVEFSSFCRNSCVLWAEKAEYHNGKVSHDKGADHCVL